MSRIETATLQAIMNLVRRGARRRFDSEFRGPILLAMGVLTADEAEGPLLNTTLRMHFADEAKHDQRLKHPLSGVGFHLDLPLGERLVLGRGGSCDIVVPDGSVSEQHCRLEIVEEGLAVDDLQSTNGTRINQAQLRAGSLGHLGDGDLLTVGRYSFQLSSPDTLYRELEAIALLGDR